MGNVGALYHHPNGTVILSTRGVRGWDCSPGRESGSRTVETRSRSSKRARRRRRTRRSNAGATQGRRPPPRVTWQKQKQLDLPRSSEPRDRGSRKRKCGTTIAAGVRDSNDVTPDRRGRVAGAGKGVGIARRRFGGGDAGFCAIPERGVATPRESRVRHHPSSSPPPPPSPPRSLAPPPPRAASRLCLVPASRRYSRSPVI